jgi:hypothetical protein
VRGLVILEQVFSGPKTPKLLRQPSGSCSTLKARVGGDLVVDAGTRIGERERQRQVLEEDQPPSGGRRHG